MNQTGIINSLVDFGYSESHARDLYNKYLRENKITYLEEYIKAKQIGSTTKNTNEIEYILSDR